MCSANGIFAQLLALLDTNPIITNRIVFVVQIELQHILGFFRGFYGLRRDSRHSAQVVDLVRKRNRVLQFLGGVHRQFVGDRHVLGTFEHLRIHYVRNDRLVLALQILVKQLDEFFARHLCFCFSHDMSSAFGDMQLMRSEAPFLSSLRKPVQS